MTWLQIASSLTSALILAALITQLRAGAVREARLARAMHELRNPLHTAMLVAERSESAKEAGINLHLRRCALTLEQFDETGPRLSGREFDAAAVARSVVASWPSPDQMHVENLSEPLTVIGDARLLEQAISNLIANGLEHGCGRVMVSAVRRGSLARIVVTDEGSGPCRAIVLARPRRRRGARGHGLAIAQSASNRLGGRLIIRPDQGRGVAIELPLATEGPAIRPRGVDQLGVASDVC